MCSKGTNFAPPGADYHHEGEKIMKITTVASIGSVPEISLQYQPQNPATPSFHLYKKYILLIEGIPHN